MGAASSKARSIRCTLYNHALSAQEVAGLVAGSLPPTGLACTNLAAKPTTTTSGEKPQSKVWQYAGAWWSVFPTDVSGASSAGTWLWKLVGTTWTEVLRASSRTDAKADVKVAGNLIHALLYADTNTQLVSAQYNTGTGAYQLWSSTPRAVEYLFAQQASRRSTSTQPAGCG